MRRAIQTSNFSPNLEHICHRGGRGVKSFVFIKGFKIPFLVETSSFRHVSGRLENIYLNNLAYRLTVSELWKESKSISK
jgi:hypothetical protein